MLGLVPRGAQSSRSGSGARAPRTRARTELEPRLQRARVKGEYIIENHTDAPLNAIHLRWDRALHDVAIEVEGAKLAWKVGRSMREDSSATIVLAHWPSPVAAFVLSFSRSAYLADRTRQASAAQLSEGKR